MIGYVGFKMSIWRESRPSLVNFQPCYPASLANGILDEQLQFMLTVCIEHPSADVSEEPDKPPFDLLEFLAHLQVSLEATYISPIHTVTPDVGHTSRLPATPRTSSFGRLHVQSDALTPRADLHPSIFPPYTPNPTPSTAGEDRRYIRSEGTLLLASIWGQNASEDSPEAFTLLWSRKHKIWVAVYRLGLTVCQHSLPRCPFPVFADTAFVQPSCVCRCPILCSV